MPFGTHEIVLAVISCLVGVEMALDSCVKQRWGDQPEGDTLGVFITSHRALSDALSNIIAPALAPAPMPENNICTNVIMMG